MLGQKIEEQCEVAPISGDGMGRGAALAGEPGGPQPDRRAQIVGGRRTAPAAPAPAILGKPPFAGSPAAVEPLRYGNFEGAGEEGQQLGPEAGMEGVRHAGSDAHQPDRRRTAERQPQQRLRANETGRPAEQRRIALDVGAQEGVAVGPEQLSTVPDGRRWMPWTGRRGIREAVLSTPSVTTSTSSSTAKSVVTICSRCSKLGARSIATTALCTRHWLARLPRLVAIRLLCSSCSRARS